jgi:NADPH-dependent ferric siderophore reductase
MQTVPPARRAAGRTSGRSSVTGVVTAIDPAARRMLRIRIEGADIPGLSCQPGQHVRVQMADLRDPRSWLRPRDLLRTYSVWQHGQCLELCVLDHGGDGPGARWARELQVGDQVDFGRPEGSFTLREGAPYHLFAGEETAAVAFGPMLRALPPAAAVYGVVEVDQPDDRLPLAGELTWRYRQGRPADASASLLQAVRQLALPAEPGAAYLAGEATTVQLLRQHLTADRGWPRSAIVSKPFWTPGKRGLD